MSGGGLTKEVLADYLRAHPLAVLATASADGRPEAALVNIAATPDLDIVFETTSATRKFTNLKSNPRVSLVVGWQGGKTLQVDGMVEELEASAYERLTPAFFAAFPEKGSHAYWPGNSYFRIRPTWFRLSDYNYPRNIAELALPEPLLAGPAGRIRRWLRGG